jgi:hypothetical protein
MSVKLLVKYMLNTTKEQDMENNRLLIRDIPTNFNNAGQLYIDWLLQRLRQPYSSGN